MFLLPAFILGSLCVGLYAWLVQSAPAASDDASEPAAGEQFSAIVAGGNMAQGPGSLARIDREINSRLALTLGLFGLSALGRLGIPTLLEFALPGFLYISIPFLLDAWRQVMTEGRIGLAVGDAILGVSMISLGYFVTLSLFGSLYLATRKILLKTRDHSRRSLVNLFGEYPHTVWLVRDGIELEVPLGSLQIGDVVAVRSGETIPFDGTIVDGMALLDQHLLTGEAQPAEKETGDAVFGATLVLSGRILIRVDRTGSETVAARIATLLNQTAEQKSTVELRGEVLAERSAAPMLGLAAITLPFLGGRSALAVLGCTPGYSLRVTGPISVLNFLHLASRNGILVKDGRAFERLSEIDTVVFDKTGTLTDEQLQIAGIHPRPGHTADGILRYAAAAEYRQKHPVARAIVEAAQARSLDVPPADASDYEIGYGIRTHVGDERVSVGSARFMALEHIAIPADFATLQNASHQAGNSLVYVAVEDGLAGAVELRPNLRPEAKSVIDRLRQRDLAIYIISGDREEPTRQLAAALGIDEYTAETLPEHKSAVVARLRAEGRSVCFVGDGINDAIALKTADASISLRGAATIATDTAHIVLMDGSLRQLPRLFDLADELESNIGLDVTASLVPSALAVVSVYVYGSGVAFTSLIGYLGLIAGIGNAMLPLLSSWQAVDHAAGEGPNSA